MQLDRTHFHAGIAFASLLLILLRGLSSQAATPLLEAKELFPATTNRYYHIPGLVITRQGSVLAYAERDRELREDLDALAQLGGPATSRGIGKLLAKAASVPSLSSFVVLREPGGSSVVWTVERVGFKPTKT